MEFVNIEGRDDEYSEVGPYFDGFRVSFFIFLAYFVVIQCLDPPLWSSRWQCAELAEHCQGHPN